MHHPLWNRLGLVVVLPQILFASRKRTTSPTVCIATRLVMKPLRLLKSVKLLPVILVGVFIFLGLLIIEQFLPSGLSVPLFLRCPGVVSRLLHRSIFNDSLLNGTQLYNINPTCLCGEEGRYVLLLVATISAISHIRRREDIRKSWNGERDAYWRLCNSVVSGMENCQTTKQRVKIVFVVGMTLDMDLQQKLEEEMKEHGDIIQGNFLDHYRNLTVKSLLMLHWWKTFCPLSTKYLLKIDDNVYLNLPLMLRTISAIQRNLSSPSSAPGFIAGYTIGVNRVNRKTHSKFYIPPSQYPKQYFPGYVAGPAYIISRAAAEPLWKASLRIPRIHIEDVYLSGLCRTEAGIAMVNRTEFCSRVRVKQHSDSCAAEHREKVD